MRVFRIILMMFALPLAHDGWAQDATDAYLDPASRRMVAEARTRNESANREIEGYEMLARQRLSVGLEATRRDRLIFRRELASRVSWTRESGRRSEVLGAREATPIVRRGVQPVEESDFARGVADLAIDPMRGWLLRLPSGDDASDDGELVHPLAEGSEAHYRFQAGDTTSIRLADGRVIRLVELQVLPRRARANLLSGSFWLDAETNAPIRGVFSLAAPARIRPEASFGIISLPFPEAAATMRFLTIEYGLWESRWWLPRLVAFEGSATIGGIAVPIVFEQSYEDYRLYTSGNPFPGFAEPDTTRFRIVERRCRSEANDCPERLVLVPRDTSLLLRSAELPRSIYSRGSRLVGSRELNEVAEFLSQSRWRGMLNRIPRVYWSPIDGNLVRYNRVEGVTIGTSAGVDLEPLSASAAVWMGVADRSPSFALELGRARLNGRETLSAYRRLEAFSPSDRPFAIGSSLSAFLFGRDDGDYYRALGFAISSVQAPESSLSLRLRGYAERQTAVVKETDASLAYWLRDTEFRENPAADEANQVGVEGRARFTYGLDPSGLRFGLDAGMMGETGSYRFGRPSVAAYSTFPLPGPLLGALDASAGTSVGTLPVQRLWYVGGRGTVRGIGATERVAGDAFWTARTEVATDRPGARLVLFGDAGWAGSRADFSTDPRLISAGVGVSFLDGLVRADLAKAIRGGSGWSFQLHLDAPL